jgi:hypothetical protein
MMGICIFPLHCCTLYFGKLSGALIIHVWAKKINTCVSANILEKNLVGTG